MSSLPDQNPLSAESLWQALGALRAAVHRAAETDLAVLLAVESGQAAGEAQGTVPIFGQRCEASARKWDCPPWLTRDASGSPDQTLAAATARFQAEFIGDTIQKSDGNMSRAAGRLGLNRSNLYRKMRQLGMAAVEGTRD